MLFARSCVFESLCDSPNMKIGLCEVLFAVNNVPVKKCKNVNLENCNTEKEKSKKVK